MSIRPINFLPNGDLEVAFDEHGHQGTIAAADVKWTTSMDGSEDHRYIILECPDGCGSTSTHPVGGGADAPNVQEMFVRKINAEGCVCGTVQRTAPAQAAMDHVHELVTEMDGEERWQVNEEELPAALG